MIFYYHWYTVYLFVHHGPPTIVITKGFFMPLPRNWFLLLRQYQSPCRIHALWKEWHECWTALIMLSIFSFLSFFGGRQFDIIEWLETWESERWESCFCHYQLCDLRKTSLSFISSRVKCRKIYFVHKTVWGLHFINSGISSWKFWLVPVPDWSEPLLVKQMYISH